MSTRKLIYIGLFIAIGIVLPQSFHLFGGAALGSVFLPIHLPVFIGAMLLGPLAGVLIAIGSLAVGVLLGMPTPVIALFMFFEMITYGLVTGYLYYTKKWNVYLSLLIGKLSGMTASLVMVHVILSLVNLVGVPPVFGSVLMFSAGIPGIIIQFVVVPIVVLRLKKVITFE